MQIVYIVGTLLVGVLFGFILQRGRFCMVSAFRDPLVMKEYN
ncbi:MAG: YeeE/YedE family protein, partial [Promethearchaeota archaeon]